MIMKNPKFQILNSKQYQNPNDQNLKLFRIWCLEFRNSAPMRGQGLLEAVIALGIIITGVVAALTLAISNLSGAGTSEARITAANLAREGVEFVRNERDSNWVARRSWDANIIAAPLARLYYASGTGMYSTDNTGQATRFFRGITLTNICADGVATCGASDRVGIRVQADVAWERRGVLPQRPQVRVVADLYKWR